MKLQANASGGYDLIQPDVVVTENQATLEVTEGESNNSFDSLFTVTTKDGGTATRTYQLNGASTSYTNTRDLAVGTHTITCTATYNGVSDSAYTTIVVKSALPDFSSVSLGYDSEYHTVVVGVPQGYTPVVLSCIREDGKDCLGNAEIVLINGEWCCFWDSFDTGRTYNVHVGFKDSNGNLLDVDLYFENTSFM